MCKFHYVYAMIKHEINSVLNEYTLDELKENQQDLLKKAHSICLSAYAPYSMFKVGASLILKNGQIINGSNQENVAYPSSALLKATHMAHSSSG